MDSAGSVPDRTRRRALLAAGLALLTLAVYAPVDGFAWVDYDDDLLVTTVREVRGGLSWEGVRWAFTSLDAANWFPLTRLSWMLDVELFGLDPGALHRTNALLHALAAGLLLLALARLTGDDVRSTWVAAVFALHPLHVESVAWVAARRDVLSGLLAAGVLLAWAGAARRGGWARQALVFALLAAGLMSKSTLVVWPVILLLLDVWPLGRLRRDGGLAWQRLPALLREKAALFALALLAGALALVAQARGETLRSLEHFPLGVRLANALASLLHYTADAFWPRGLSVFYPHPGAEVSLAAVAGGLGLLGLFAGVASWGWRRQPACAVGLLWYLVALLPVIGVVQVGQAARADRYTYLPLVGLAIAVAWGVGGPARGRARRWVAAAAVASLLLLAVATRVQLGTWRDSESLFTHALRVTERNHVAHINLAPTRIRQGRLDEAAAHLLAARRLVPASPVAAGLLGDVRLAQQRLPEALALYRQALTLDPDSRRWRLALARALVAEGRVDEALRVLRELSGQPSRSAR